MTDFLSSLYPDSNAIRTVYTLNQQTHTLKIRIGAYLNEIEIKRVTFKNVSAFKSSASTLEQDEEALPQSIIGFDYGETCVEGVYKWELNGEF